MRTFLIAVLVCASTAGWAVVGAGSAHAATAGCSGTIRFTALTFDPPTVSPGQHSTVTLTVQNCTDQAQRPLVSLVPRYVPPAGGGFSFCGANDPYPLQPSLAPGGSSTTSVLWSIFSGCRASGLHLTATFFGPSGTVTRGADLTIVGS